MGKGKKYNSALQKYDRQQRYSVVEAVGILREIESASYDETVESRSERLGQGNGNFADILFVGDKRCDRGYRRGGLNHLLGASGSGGFEIWTGSQVYNR